MNSNKLFEDLDALALSKRADVNLAEEILKKYISEELRQQIE